MVKYHTMFSVGFLGEGGERLTYAEHFLDLLLIFFKKNYCTKLS